LLTALVIIVQDVAIFAFLSHLPQVYLLRMFYRVHIATALKLIVIELFSLTFPIALLHRLPLTKFLAPLSTTLTNLSIPITLLTSAIYALIAYASFLTWAPAHLATRFHGIRDISLVYDAQFPHLICYFLPVGMAVVAFVYNPAAAAPPRPNTKDAKAKAHKPATKTLWQKLTRENWMKLTPRTQEIVKRTAAVIVVGGGKSWLHTWAMLKGVDAFGAAGYTGIFELGALVTGIVYWWVGDV
jgi:hypothetical protein